MSETRWTPGPWVWQRDPMLYGEDFVGVYADAATGDHLRCQVLGDNQDADAALIAAAPDLYEALEAVMDAGAGPMRMEALRKAGAAMARARGEED